MEANSLFPVEPVIKCFVMHPGSKIEKKNTNKVLLDARWHTICCGFKVHDLITGEWKLQLVVFAGELVSFDP